MLRSMNPIFLAILITSLFIQSTTCSMIVVESNNKTTTTTIILTQQEQQQQSNSNHDSTTQQVIINQQQQQQQQQQQHRRTTTTTIISSWVINDLNQRNEFLQSTTQKQNFYLRQRSSKKATTNTKTSALVDRKLQTTTTTSTSTSTNTEENRIIEFIIKYQFISSPNSPTQSHLNELKYATESWLIAALHDPGKYCNALSSSNIDIGQVIQTTDPNNPNMYELHVPMVAIITFDKSSSSLIVPSQDEIGHFLKVVNMQPYIQHYIWKLQDTTSPFWNTHQTILAIDLVVDPQSLQTNMVWRPRDGPSCHANNNNNNNNNSNNNNNGNNNNSNNNNSSGQQQQQQPVVVSFDGEFGFGYPISNVPNSIPTIDDMINKLQPWLNSYITNELSNQYGSIDYISTKTLIDTTTATLHTNNNNAAKTQNGIQYDSITIKVKFENTFSNHVVAPYQLELYTLMSELDFKPFIYQYLWQDDATNGYWHWVMQFSWSSGNNI